MRRGGAMRDDDTDVAECGFLDGRPPRWKILYERIRDREPGSVITYGELGETLGLDPYTQRPVIRSALRRAATELLEKDRMLLKAEHGVGYRVTLPDERLTLVNADRSSALRRLEAGHAKATHVDLRAIRDPEVRKALEQTGQIIGLQLDFNRRLNERTERLEDVMSTLVQTSENTRQAMENMQERLARLEAGRRPQE